MSVKAIQKLDALLQLLTDVLSEVKLSRQQLIVLTDIQRTTSAVLMEPSDEDLSQFQDLSMSEHDPR